LSGIAISLQAFVLTRDLIRKSLQLFGIMLGALDPTGN
jgi:hypothetical protein